MARPSSASPSGRRRPAAAPAAQEAGGGMSTRRTAAPARARAARPCARWRVAADARRSARRRRSSVAALLVVAHLGHLGRPRRRHGLRPRRGLARRARRAALRRLRLLLRAARAALLGASRVVGGVGIGVVDGVRPALSVRDRRRDLRSRAHAGAARSARSSPRRSPRPSPSGATTAQLRDAAHATRRRSRSCYARCSSALLGSAVGRRAAAGCWSQPARRRARRADAARSSRSPAPSPPRLGRAALVIGAARVSLAPRARSRSPCPALAIPALVYGAFSRRCRSTACCFDNLYPDASSLRAAAAHVAAARTRR